MTYFGYLLRFLGIPLAIMIVLTISDWRRGRPMAQTLTGRPALLVMLAHVVVALLYTTPWDNYLVATGVWWYDPALVSGLTIGWVPIEEYTFFVLQPILTGLWLIWLARRGVPSSAPLVPRPRLRRCATFALALIWLASLGLLVSGWQPGTYLALIFVWALPPIMLQTIFGADILWHQRRLVGLVIASATFYLAATDAVAIGAGTWTIDPQQSLHVLLGGVLPLEEFLFFLVTNTLIAFGITLVTAVESQPRAEALARALARRLPARRTRSGAAGD